MEMMRRFLAFIFFVYSFSTYGQTLENKHHRVLILLDASLIMNEPADGYATKYAAASDFIIRLMDSIYHRNDEVEFGLRVYGHQYPASARQCFDTKLEVQFSRDNIEQMELRLTDLKPKGRGSVAMAFDEALDYDLANTDGYFYHFLIISDSADRCGRNLCDVIQTLGNKKINSICLVTLNERHQTNCSNNTYVLSSNEQLGLVIKSIITECCVVPILSRKLKVNDAKNSTLVNTLNTRYSERVLPQLQSSSVVPVRIENFKPTPQLAVVPEYETPIDGMGSLKIANMVAIKEIKLFYEENGALKELTNLKIENIYTGQRIQLLSGKYNIQYTIKIGEHFGKSSHKNFSIVRNMITEIILD